MTELPIGPNTDDGPYRWYYMWGQEPRLVQVDWLPGQEPPVIPRQWFE